MKIQAPNYIPITPLIGELHWNLKPSDDLLELQLGWISWLNAELSHEIEEVRQGFSAIGIRWKNEVAQKRFAGNYLNMPIKPYQLSGKIWEVPVCYESNYGTDLGNLALQKHMRVNDLIELHSSTLYRIHFFGFLPGFMYLNGLPEALHTPRKAVPDRSVYPGSVGIGGSQTGIYPMESPGGWHIFGRTPIQLFDPEQDPPVWASIGDQIQFVRISAEEMNDLLENPTLPSSR
ncbi:5-oxoprolinase subunit PxpB [Algoriphagus mannitolivorans]|uniref:5-oxoprolinase subunit PxpB n=1 Tax=Algoriphagus mannitolivorans TaxID=226504 RepID=UPI0003FCFE9F|nr:5-oxoprolinase subunit PxpB [Algoriphagus mannitolivorans]